METDIVEPPGRWEWSPGEASRPLSEGGYYLHIAIRVIWENQHQRRYYEARIDTEGMPPKRHHLDIRERIEDKNAGDSWDIDIVARDAVAVEHPEDEDSQEDAEERIHDLAHGHMEDFAHEAR